MEQTKGEAAPTQRDQEGLPGVQTESRPKGSLPEGGDDWEGGPDRRGSRNNTEVSNTWGYKCLGYKESSMLPEWKVLDGKKAGERNEA